ncbi:MAG: hypothetical protein Q7R64_00080 [bacterium]|nr:hypothetical protein [bacterium]
MQHFVCTGGCDGESSTPGVCQSEGCEKEGEPLTACSCEDGLHEETEEKETSDDGE